MIEKEDMNKYNNSHIVPTERTVGELGKTSVATAKTVGSIILKAIKTLFFIAMFSGLLVFIAVASHVLSFKDTEPPNLNTMKLNFSSFVYYEKSPGDFVKYTTLHAQENRVWVDYKDIPKHMVNAIIAIEDKRFMTNSGFDIQRTGGAVTSFFTGGGGGGGSTLTQQLIKNITGENQVSILRKIKEIFMAINLEKKYSKEEILEAYLNVVHFGSNTNGVQAAANLYFGKNISECDIAEVASIAGITQFPYKYTPLSFPENNKMRQKIVLDQMHEQGYINKQEYEQAMEKAESKMVFVGYQYELDESGKEETGDVWNWYMETMFNELLDDLAEYYNISREKAYTSIYNSGLEIYMPMNLDLQTGVENLLKNPENLPADEDVDLSGYFMDYSGNALAIIGSRYEKTGNLVFNNATDSHRQLGSSIKPIAIYAPAFELGEITYGTVLIDKALPNYFGENDPGPFNFDRTYSGTMNVDKAIEVSQNAPPAQLVNKMGLDKSLDFLQNKMHFKFLDPSRDLSIASMALGGMTNGATAREAAGAFQIFGNGGKYFKPHTYSYVKDHEGNVILDHRDEAGEQAISYDNATIMNHLLRKPIYGPNGTAQSVRVGDNTLFGKTGTSNDYLNIWFAGGTPFAVGAVWNGYKIPEPLSDDTTAKSIWTVVMNYLNDNAEQFGLTGKSYAMSENVQEIYFCRSSGLIAGGSCYNTDLGYYSPDNTPKTCNGGSDHINSNDSTSSKKPTGSPSTSGTPKPSTNPDTSSSATSPSPTPPAPPTVAPPTVAPPTVAPPTDPPAPPTVAPPTEPPPEPPAPPTEEPPPFSIPDIQGTAANAFPDYTQLDWGIPNEVDLTVGIPGIIDNSGTVLGGFDPDSGEIITPDISPSPSLSPPPTADPLEAPSPSPSPHNGFLPESVGTPISEIDMEFSKSPHVRTCRANDKLKLSSQYKYGARCEVVSPLLDEFSCYTQLKGITKTLF